MTTINLTDKQIKQIATQVASIIAPAIVSELASEIAESLKADKPLLTTKQKAEQLGIEPATLRKWVREGKIDAVKSGDSNQAKLYFR